MRRRNEATERSRTSSALSAVTSVRRPRCFLGAPRGAAGRRGGRARGAAPAPRRRARRFVVVGFERRDARRAPARVESRRRRSASWRLRRPCVLVSSSCLRRSSSSRLRASAASRSVRSIASRLARRRASSSAILRSSASRTRDIGERMGAGGCALPRSACAARRRTASACRRRRRSERGSAAPRRRARGALASALDGRRRSRPWLRPAADDAAFDLLDHDLLAAAMAEALAHDARLGARLERQRLAETLSFFSPGFLVSLIPYCVLMRRLSAHAR